MTLLNRLRKCASSAITYQRHIARSLRSFTASHTIQSYGCSISRYGAPLDVADITQTQITFDDNSDELLLKCHAAPINPSDINIMEGRYAVLPPKLPSVVGNDGIFEVTKKGKQCSSSAPELGQFVVPFKPLLGTWQQYMSCKESDIIPVAVNMSDFEKYDSHMVAQLSMLTVNPCTAYRMINDFVPLDDGDYILQNAANSAVGECVIQIAKMHGIKSINIIRGSVDGTASRSPSEFERIKEHLMSLGASAVIGDADLAAMHKEDRQKLVGSSPPTLALNCVGGPVVADMLKLMTSEKSSVMVTYGGMSKQPLTIPTAPFIFRDLTLTGFWMSAWKNSCFEHENLAEEYYDMIQNLTDMIKQHDLQVSYKLIRFGAKGEGMRTGLKYAMNEVDEMDANDEVFMIGRQDKGPPVEIRGKAVMVFD